MKLTASSTRVLPFGMTTRSPPMNDAVRARLDARQERDPELERVIGHLVAGERDVEVARAHHAELAGPELEVERLAVLGLGALGDVAGLDHVARPTGGPP